MYSSLSVCHYTSGPESADAHSPDTDSTQDNTHLIRRCTHQCSHQPPIYVNSTSRSARCVAPSSVMQLYLKSRPVNQQHTWNNNTRVHLNISTSSTCTDQRERDRWKHDIPVLPCVHLSYSLTSQSRWMFPLEACVRMQPIQAMCCLNSKHDLATCNWVVVSEGSGPFECDVSTECRQTCWGWSNSWRKSERQYKKLLLRLENELHDAANLPCLPLHLTQDF